MAFQKGHIISEETRRKMSITRTGRPCSEETKRKISKAMKGKKPSEKTIEAVKLANTGKKQSKESIEKRVKANTGKKRTKETKEKMRLAQLGRKGQVAWNKGLKGFLSKEKHYNWKGGISKDIAKYTKDRYKKLSNEDKKRLSWVKNKRNRVIKRLKIESLTHTYGEWELLKNQYGYTCPCCKKPEPDISLTEDHIIPLSKGGSDLIENIQPLCMHCNNVKYTKIIKYDI